MLAAPPHPPTAVPESSSPLTSEDTLPIGLHKGKRSCTAHLLANSFLLPTLALSIVLLLFLFHLSQFLDRIEAPPHPKGTKNMDKEISALISRGI